jgi:HlyD family secretion protein
MNEGGAAPEAAVPAVSSAPAAVRQQVLAETSAPRRWMLPLLWLALALALIAAALWWWNGSRQAAQAVRYRTVPVVRGKVALTVTANGSLQPTRAVNIGSELSGTVTRVLVDVNDQVRKGQVLVELDTSKLRDQVQRSRAALAAAQAAVEQAAATRVEAAASLGRLESMARASGGALPAPLELDTGRAALARAIASEASAKASVASARAALATDTTNLGKAAIRSPIDGVILTRNVDPGNAVAASLQAVTLFTLAEDLRHLRLLVNIDEADVAQVRTGMDARFTVSSYPARQYPATITRVSYGSTLTDNVVTYIGYLDVDNADLSLRPGMSATASIHAAERSQVLLVPNSALRFTPAAAGQGRGAGVVGRLMPRMPPPTRQSGVAGVGAHRVWVLQGGVPQAVAITTGISDGRVTEVLAGKLEPGMPVITEQLGSAEP